MCIVNVINVRQTLHAQQLLNVPLTSVYIVSHSGSYGEWGFDQPNNYDGHQSCGALDRFKATKLVDESCDESKVYICKLGEYCTLTVSV